MCGEPPTRGWKGRGTLSVSARASFVGKVKRILSSSILCAADFGTVLGRFLGLRQVQGRVVCSEWSFNSSSPKTRRIVSVIRWRGRRWACGLEPPPVAGPAEREDNVQLVGLWTGLIASGLAIRDFRAKARGFWSFSQRWWGFNCLSFRFGGLLKSKRASIELILPLITCLNFAGRAARSGCPMPNLGGGWPTGRQRGKAQPFRCRRAGGHGFRVFS